MIKGVTLVKVLLTGYGAVYTSEHLEIQKVNYIIGALVTL